MELDGSNHAAPGSSGGADVTSARQLRRERRAQTVLEYENQAQGFMRSLMSEDGLEVAISLGTEFESSAIDGDYGCPIPGCLEIRSRKDRMRQHLTTSPEANGHKLPE